MPIATQFVKVLRFPERHYLNSALGWLGLGKPIEAKAEVDRICGLNRFHPEVFVVRWQIQGRLGNWEAARDLARLFTEMFPDRPSGWLCLSYSFYKLNRALDAYLELLPRVEAFPDVNAVPYFMACYSWELGDLTGTGEWLAKFKSMGGNIQVKPNFWDQTELLLHWDQLHSLPSSSKPSSSTGPIALT